MRDNSYVDSNESLLIIILLLYSNCEICYFKAKNQHHLTSHVLKTHRFDHDDGPRKKEKACPICGTIVRELNRHIKKTHLNHKNYRCDICSYGSFFKTEIELHMKSHLKKEAQHFYCEFCSREFTKRHLLNRHIKLKHTEKERIHQCSQCDKCKNDNHSIQIRAINKIFIQPSSPSQH